MAKAKRERARHTWDANMTGHHRRKFQGARGVDLLGMRNPCFLSRLPLRVKPQPAGQVLQCMYAKRDFSMCSPAAVAARAMMILFFVLVLSVAASGAFSAAPNTRSTTRVQVAPTAAMIPTFAATTSRGSSSEISYTTAYGSWRGGRGPRFGSSVGRSRSGSLWDRTGCRGGSSTGAASLR